VLARRFGFRLSDEAPTRTVRDVVLALQQAAEAVQWAELGKGDEARRNLGTLTNLDKGDEARRNLGTLTKLGKGDGVGGGVVEGGKVERAEAACSVVFEMLCAQWLFDDNAAAATPHVPSAHDDADTAAAASASGAVVGSRYAASASSAVVATGGPALGAAAAAQHDAAFASAAQRRLDATRVRQRQQEAQRQRLLGAMLGDSQGGGAVPLDLRGKLRACADRYETLARTAAERAARMQLVSDASGANGLEALRHARTSTRLREIQREQATRSGLDELVQRARLSAVEHARAVERASRWCERMGIDVIEDLLGTLPLMTFDCL
jgi:hypothetical protein